MKVVLLAAPIEALTAKQAADVAQAAWFEERPNDDLDVFIVSDGRPPRGGGSGLAEVIGGLPVLGEAEDTPHIWRTDTQVLLDYTEILGFSPDSEREETTSRIVGRDMVWAAAEGLREAIVALPGPSPVSDLGRAMLEVLAGGEGEMAGNASGAAGSGDELADLLRAARAGLGSLRVSVLAADMQRLTGFEGLARMWMRRAGLSPAEAQQRDRDIGEAVDALRVAARSGTVRFLDEGPDPRGVYAGAGGGVAFALQALGARVMSVGDVSVRARLAEPISHADLVVYLAGRIEADLPSGLLAAISLTCEGVPVVLMYDHGGIEKTELSNLALAGAHELRPHLAFMPAGPALATADEMRAILARRTHAVARTWGY